MKLTFPGANRNVTGSRYCLEVAGKRMMIDCGLVQDREHLSRNWETCPTPAGGIEALVVTHAHIDYIGLIPKLVADGFRGQIFATKPTAALADVMLRDSAKIQAEDAKYKRRRHRKEGRKGPHPVVPLYSDQDVEKAIQLFRGVDYRVPTENGSSDNTTCDSNCTLIPVNTPRSMACRCNCGRSRLSSTSNSESPKVQLFVTLCKPAAPSHSPVMVVRIWNPR